MQVEESEPQNSLKDPDGGLSWLVFAESLPLVLEIVLEECFTTSPSMPDVCKSRSLIPFPPAFHLVM